MPRMRVVKPTLFNNEELAECPPLARLLFIGLWCWADREGRLEDRPKRIKADILPYDAVEVEPILRELDKRGFIQRYQVNGKRLIQITTFHIHQRPHPKEGESTLPAPPVSVELHGTEAESREKVRQSRVIPRQSREKVSTSRVGNGNQDLWESGNGSGKNPDTRAREGMEHPLNGEPVEVYGETQERWVRYKGATDPVREQLPPRPAPENEHAPSEGGPIWREMREELLARLGRGDIGRAGEYPESEKLTFVSERDGVLTVRHPRPLTNRLRTEVEALVRQCALGETIVVEWPAEAAAS